jgi:hypothetical protein
MEVVWVEIDGVGDVFDFGFDRTDSQFSNLSTETSYTLTGYAAAFATSDVGQVLVTEIVGAVTSINPRQIEVRRDRWVIKSIDTNADEVELELVEGRFLSRVPVLATYAIPQRYYAWVERKTRYHYGPRPTWAPGDGSWVRLLHTVGDLSPSAIPLEGGIATPPSTTVQLAYSAPTPAPEVARLVRSRYPVIRTENIGIISSAPASVSWRPESRIPPALTGTARVVVWPGLACIGAELAYIRDDESARVVFRGVLDTTVSGAFRQTAFAEWPSGRSSVVRVYRASSTDEDIRDAQLLFAGRCNDVRLSDDGASLQLQCAGLLATAADRRANLPVIEQTVAATFGVLSELDVQRQRSSGGSAPRFAVWGGTWLSDVLFSEVVVPSLRIAAIVDEVSDLGGVRVLTADPRRENFPEFAFVESIQEAYLTTLGEQPQFAHLFATSQFTGVDDTKMNFLDYLGSPIGPASYYQAHTVHVVEALLTVLTSTGYGHNPFPQSPYYSTTQPRDDYPALYAGQPSPDAPGAAGSFDTLARGFGLGIPADLIDLESFLVYASTPPNQNAIVRDFVILAEDAADIFALLEDKLLKPHFLTLTTGRDGRIRLIDMGKWGPYDRDRASETYAADGTLASRDRAIPAAAWMISETPPVDRVVLRQRCYYYNPKNPRFLSGVTVTTNAGLGLTGEGYYSDREPTRYEVSLEGPLMDPSIFTLAAISYLRRHVTPRPIIAFDAFADVWVSEPGDAVVLDSFPVLPGLLGERELTALVEVLSVATRPFDSATVRVTARVLDADVDIARARWAPGLRVASAASATVFTVSEEFIPPQTFGGPFTADIQTAIVGLRVELYDQYFQLRTTEQPAVLSVAGQVVTLDAAFGVTPQAGDIVMPAPVEVQPVDLRRPWAYYEDGDVDYLVFWE